MRPHNNRLIMNPLPISSFEQVFNAILNMQNSTVTELITTGGVTFSAQAKTSSRVGKFIQLPHHNRIYPCCWGNATNHMGKDGQRIGHYTRALDDWFRS